MIVKPTKPKEEFSDTTGLVKTETKNTAGKITSTGNLLNGKKENSWIEYYDNGLIRTLTTYYHDKKDGLFLEFNTNNQVVKRCFYHNDVRHGEYKEFNSVNVKEERYYENGKQGGLTKIYYNIGIFRDDILAVSL